VVTVGAQLEAATQQIATALGLDRRDARLEAQILVSRALGVNRAWLIAHDLDELAPIQFETIAALITRRIQGEPVAYILGEKEFYGRLFKVTPDVLIPRPETELLVETALERLPKDHPVQVLDLGAGSGCVAITLALERPNCLVTAVDVSPKALEVATGNAACLGAKVEFVLSDWFTALSGRKFDLIVGNPPYVEACYPQLKHSDLAHEPPHALTSGPDGLDAIRHIVATSHEFLLPGGVLLLEHGWTQDDAVRDLLGSNGYTDVHTLFDAAGLPRCSAGTQPNGRPDTPSVQATDHATVKVVSNPEA